MEINVDDLHKISEKLFSLIKDKGIVSVKLGVDYYWNIPQSQVYNPLQEPVELDLGQLSDDWNEFT